MADNRKKGSMSQVLTDIKPYITKNTMAAPSTVARQVKPVPMAAKVSSRISIATSCPRDWGTFSLCRAGPFYLGVPAPGAGQNRNPGSRPGGSSSSRNIPAVRASNSAGSAALRSFLA